MAENHETASICTFSLSEYEYACLDRLALKARSAAQDVIRELIEREYALQFSTTWEKGAASDLLSVLNYTPMTAEEIHGAMVRLNPQYATWQGLRPALKDLCDSGPARKVGPDAYVLANGEERQTP